jgi:hypothetical protein
MVITTHVVVRNRLKCEFSGSNDDVGQVMSMFYSLYKKQSDWLVCGMMAANCLQFRKSFSQKLHVGLKCNKGPGGSMS